MYGGAEASLSAAVRDRRDDVSVATKIWARSVDEGREQYRRQLAWFGRVEVEQVHNLVLWREHVAWLEAEREAGEVGRLGVTHFSPSAFDELGAALETGRFDAVQLPLNPRERAAERRLLPLAAELEPLHELGVETWEQALLKWALSDERVDVVIPATRDPLHARSNAAAGSPPWLGAAERALVERLAA
jgi:diketogulonate reductase-like aldo/keto reductase